MASIIFDLETTMSFSKGEEQRIIQIGAVKFNDSFEIVDKYNMYVNPQKYIRKTTKKFIGAKDVNFDIMSTFDETFNHFSNWASDSKYIFSWGNDDLIFLVEHCKKYNLELNWARKYRNLQRIISMALFGNEAIGLKKILKKLDIEIEGRLHDALIDSINTLNILRYVRDKVDINDKQYEINIGEYYYCVDCGKQMEKIVEDKRHHMRCYPCRLKRLERKYNERHLKNSM